MKRMISILSVLMIGITLTACGSGDSAETPGVAENDRSIVQEKLNKQDNKAENTDSGDEDKQTEAAEAPDGTASAPETDTDSTNILVAYFSRADENYNVGTIDIGNTQIIAEYIASEVDADSFHIETITPYPVGYDDCCDVAKQELADKARPELNGTVENMEQYDIVFLGYPIWWGDMPMAVYTFMDNYELSDKVIIPFCTHEGSGLSGTDKSIADYTGAQVLTAIDMRGSTAQEFSSDTQQAVCDRLDGLGF